jgi:hypothetical protein
MCAILEYNLQYAGKIGMAVKVGFEAFQPPKEKAVWMPPAG